MFVRDLQIFVFMIYHFYCHVILMAIRISTVVVKVWVLTDPNMGHDGAKNGS